MVHIDRVTGFCGVATHGRVTGYHEAVNQLERLRRLRSKLGTETTAALLTHLNDPHEDLTCVQVAGSNGKGSTARVLGRILREAGLSVGC